MGFGPSPVLVRARRTPMLGLGPGAPKVRAVPRAERSSGTWTRVAVVVLVSFLCGMATFSAQALLPDAVSSFANSASGWTFVTVLVLAWARVRTAFAAVLGAASFVLLTLGYSVSAGLQDLTYDPTLFVLVGVLVGPFVGIATSWLRAESAWHAAAGTALLSGIGLGEAAYGLTEVADTTSPVYWTLVGAVALAFLVTMLIRRIHGVRAVLLTVAGTAAIAVAFVVAYGALGGA